jgi:hypothetical protein
MMKKLIPIFCILLIFSACKKSGVAPYSSQGVILGEDPRMCPFCGGLKISIKNDPTNNPPEFYLINTSRSVLINLGSDPHFPINVILDWKRDTSMYSGNFIIITRIKLIN